MEETKETIDVEATVVEEVSLKPVEQSKTPFVINWNFEELKAELDKHLKTYSGLVVTAENLQSMSKTHREIVSLRTGLEKFRLSVKKEAEKPIKEFENNVKVLAGLIAKVETPIKNQLDKYEEQRREIKATSVKAIIANLVNEYKLTTHSGELVVLDKYLAKGADELDTLADLRAKAQELQKEEMAFELHASFVSERCATISLNHGLNTPITATPEIIKATYGKEEEFLNESIMRLARERLEIENKAAQAAQSATPAQESTSAEAPAAKPAEQPAQKAAGTAGTGARPASSGQTIIMHFIDMSQEQKTALGNLINEQGITSGTAFVGMKKTQALALKNLLDEKKIDYEVIK